MSLQHLYNTIYGDHTIATEEQLKQLSVTVTLLPDEIFNVVYQYYHHAKTLAEISQDCGVPEGVVETRLGNGVEMVKIFCDAKI